MMKVVKPFSTRQRRFVVGAELSAKTDVAPHTIEDMEKREFLQSPVVKKPRAKRD